MTVGASRRTILRSALLASSVAVVAAAGNTVPFMRKVSVFAVRTGEGPQGVPVNRTAKAAGGLSTAEDPAFELTLVNGDQEVAITRADLEAMTQRVHHLPIACVEGWSAAATWTGVRFAEQLCLVDVPGNASLRVRSLQERAHSGSPRSRPPSRGTHSACSR